MTHLWESFSRDEAEAGITATGNLEKEESEIMEEEEELFASVHSSSLQVVIYPPLRPLVFPGLINGQPGKVLLQQLCSVVKTKANIEKLVS